MDQSKEAIARLVREGRAAKGYTQQELSEMTGISLRSVQRIENAEVQPRMYTLKILAEHLGFSWEGVVAPGPDPEGETVAGETVPLNTSAPETIPAEDIAQKPRRRLNKVQKIILTIGVGLFIILAVLAYIAQSARFPETQFELFALLGVLVLVYGGLVFMIWR